MNRRFAIDLLWVRYGKIGGGVSVVINLLEGLYELKDDFEAYLVITEDNCELFSRFLSDKRFKPIVFKESSLSRKKTVTLQNTQLAKVLKENKIDICLEPDNYMPILNRGKIRYITVIHDLQALHFPQYFSKAKKIWLKVNWKNAMKHSAQIIAISGFTKEDILNHYKVDEKRISVVFDPISIDTNEVADFDSVGKQFGVKSHDFYYTVSAMLENKNLKTLLKMMVVLKERGLADKKLVISGVGSGESFNEFTKVVNELGIQDNVILTGFVENSVRNALYKNCEVFLFPSIFEGFGMPPIEAKVFGAKVITTKEASLPEATQNALVYVSDPYNAEEWADRVLNTDETDSGVLDIKKYDKKVIAKEYLNVITDVIKN